MDFELQRTSERQLAGLAGPVRSGLVRGSNPVWSGLVQPCLVSGSGAVRSSPHAVKVRNRHGLVQSMAEILFQSGFGASLLPLLFGVS